MPAQTAITDRLPYIVAIEGWAAPYTFGIDLLGDPSDQGRDPFREYQVIEFWGRLIVPDLKKITMFAGRTWFEEVINRESRSRRLAKPEAVGFLSSGKGTLHATLYLPQQMYQPILTILAAQKAPFIQFDGSQLHYGQGKLRSITFDHAAPEEHLAECREIWANHKKKKLSLRRQGPTGRRPKSGL